uniref:26S proteasome regulatory subunit RPN11 C-terminal domain-containing protein n=1 Tax=Varanus komodoensis TaxID=61221 RepID=A0A8D2L272_VARKO
MLEHCKLNETSLRKILKIAPQQGCKVGGTTPEWLAIKSFGKQGPKRRLEEHMKVLMTCNIVQHLAMLSTLQLLLFMH